MFSFESNVRTSVGASCAETGLRIGMVRRAVNTFMFAALDWTHRFMCLDLSMLVRYDVADVGRLSLYSCLLGFRCAEFDAASVGH